MMELDTKKSYRILALNTITFTVCFGVWMMYGVLVKFLSMPVIVDGLLLENGYLGLKPFMYYIIVTPVLTGSLLRLPIGILTDKYGGKPITIVVLLITAVGSALVGFMKTHTGFMIAGLVFGLAGASFAVGIAYTSVWFSKGKQGVALGIFGAGNAGAALNGILGPKFLASVTGQSEKLSAVTKAGTEIQATILKTPENWVQLPYFYAILVLIMAVAFFFLAENRCVDQGAKKNLAQRLTPLKNIQVWRFGFYYFLVFGGFVALSQTLNDYYVTVYGVTLATAGLLVSIFTIPSGVIRALGGWLSDKQGARNIMYWILGVCIIGCAVLSFQTGVWVFTVVACIVGIAMGIGKAAVYKHIPVYFPKEVGVVGGMVGVLGGLGGFICPIIFGRLLDFTKSPENPEGLYTTCWMFLTAVSLVCLVWMHFAVKKIEAKKATTSPVPATA
ncbi:MAG: MFS transporter [Lentisphaeraceae bacterium]|nr:MFS transporter [Lentisphaeraceae bacterium]